MNKINLLKMHTGRFIPQIGFGTYELTKTDCYQSVKKAIKLGYRHIDTAFIYHNGKQIYQAIQDSGIKRQQFFITSKISPQYHAQKAEECFNLIMSDLNVGYLDLLLIHWPGAKNFNKESFKVRQLRFITWQIMQKLKREGKVKDIGVSNFNYNHLKHLLQNAQTIPVVNQIQIHPLYYNLQTIEFCQKKNILIESYSPLARGDVKLLNNDVVKNISQKKKRSVSQIVLRWGYELGYIILPKARKQYHMRQNLGILDFELSSIEMQNLNKLNINYKKCWNPDSIKY